MRLSPLLALTLTLALAIPTAAAAAIKSGPYTGTSSGKFQEYGKLEMSTDKGKVSFKVRRGKVVKDFKIAGQKIQCGAGGQVVPILVEKIKLNDAGKGKATYNDPNVGDFKISITVTEKGTAKGKAVPQNLCSETIFFRAKLK